MPRNIPRGRIRAAAAAALCAAMLSTGVPAVADTVIGDVGQLEITDISAQRSGSLTIRIKAGNPFDEVPSGQLPPGGLAGYVFTARRVADVNLHTSAGWEAAKNMSLAAARKAEYSLVAEATTDSSGVASFSTLPIGLYFVTASVPRDGGHKYRQPQDMLITIPVGQKAQGGSVWQYDVIINAKFDPDKPDPTTPGKPPVDPTTPGKPPVDPTTPGKPPVDPTTPGKPPVDPTTPGKPPVDPTTPGNPPVDPTTPGNPPETQKGITRLPMTGAGVLGAVGVASLLLALGAGLIATNRRRTSEEA